MRRLVKCIVVGDLMDLVDYRSERLCVGMIESGWWKAFI